MNDNEMFDCPECEGCKNYVCSHCSGNGTQHPEEPRSCKCNMCGGSGIIFCERCDGTGEVKWADLTDTEREAIEDKREEAQ